MIRFLGNLPKKCIVAFSGGIDSVSVVDFLLRGKRELKLAFFNHGTSASAQAEDFCNNFSKKLGLQLLKGSPSRVREPGESQEEYWRKVRYEFLHSFVDETIVTAHHLDDAVETWIFTALHGSPRTIPYSNKNVVRPFLVTPKSELKMWALRKNLEWIEDSSNADIKYMRNLIRHNIVPEALKVNPGLRKVVQKKYLESISKYSNFS